jgi:hypothetical protein
VDPPACPGARVFVVVAQVPGQIGWLAVGNGPMVGDAGDAAQGVVRVVPGGIHLADDGVFGPVDGGERGHRGADTVTSVVVSHRLERPGWVGQP